jgi:signal transduction histidine kinase/PAS domain-containing protein
MSQESTSTDALYEISLAIRPADTVGAVAQRALDAYVTHLDCTGGAVYKQAGDGYRRVAKVATATAADVQSLTATFHDTDHTGDLPAQRQTPAGTTYWLLDLPDFGVLALVPGDETLSRETLDALDALNETLADTCRHARTETRLREELNRSDSALETSAEPSVSVVFEDGEPIVRQVTDAFVESTGYSRSTALGANLDTLVVSDAGETTRRRKLELLYSELEGILSAGDTETACARAIQAATEILDARVGRVYLYDRTEEALLPTATSQPGGTHPVSAADADRQTAVWETYRSGEAVRIDDLTAFDGSMPDDDAIASALLVPMGDHGVLTVADSERSAFDETDVQFTRLLSTLVEITLDRTVRERGLEGIQEITQAALDANTYDEAARAVVEHISDALDLPMSSMWRYDSARDALVPLATTAKASRLVDEQPTFTGDGSIAWEVYHSGQTQMVSNMGNSDEAYNPDSVIRSEIVTAVGDFGVLATGSTQEASFSDTERRLVETLASNLETVMRLVSWRQELELLDQVLARVLRHNLRNDLTVIKGVATEIAETGDGRSADNATHIIERCDALESTADNAREMRQIVRSRDDAVSVSLDTAVENAIQSIQADYPSVSLSCTLDATPTVTAHSALTTAIRHLVENAIEHTDASDIRVRVFDENDSVGIEVTDDGPGIPRSEIETLMQHGESALEHGTGAGLWIVDRVVEYSDGSLEFETDDGTTVTIRFQA